MKVKKYNEFVDNDVYISVDIKSSMEKVEHDCGNKSNLDDIVVHPSYKDVVQNGYESIPFIIEKINIDKCHPIWIRALNEITGEYPENVLYEKGIYKSSEVRKIWKKWALNNGYL